MTLQSQPVAKVPELQILVAQKVGKMEEPLVFSHHILDVGEREEFDLAVLRIQRFLSGDAPLSPSIS